MKSLWKYLNEYPHSHKVINTNWRYSKRLITKSLELHVSGTQVEQFQLEVVDKGGYRIDQAAVNGIVTLVEGCYL